MVQYEIQKKIRAAVECENKKGYISCIMLENDNQIHIEKVFDGNYDYRLEEPKFRENAVTILMKRKETNESVFMFSLFFLPYCIYKDEFFWEKKGRYLTKRYLKDYRDLLGETIISFGYARFCNAEKVTKYIGTKCCCVTFYIRLIKELMTKFQLPVYLEPEGIFQIPQELVKSTKLEMINLPNDVLGIVRAESNTTYKLAKWLNFKEIQNFYNAYTLGPVFWGNIVKNKDELF